MAVEYHNWRVKARPSLNCRKLQCRGRPELWYTLRVLRILSTIVAAVALASSACAEPRVIRTIPEARGLSHADFLSPLDFELRGRLVYAAKELNVPSDRAVVIEDGGSSLMLHISKERPVKIPAKPGDTVVLRGQTEVNAGIYDWLRIDSATTVAVGDPPAPETATVAEMLDGLHDLKIVTVHGEISAVFRDEIDARWHFCVLRDGERNIYLAVADDSDNPAWTREIVGSQVEATGLCNLFSGLRKFSRPSVRIEQPSAIRVLRKASDPFDVPELEAAPSMPSDDVMRIGRRKVSGLVLAAWNGDRLLVKTPDGRVVRIDLALGTDMPLPGEAVCAAGTVTTDFFRLNLVDAVIMKIKDSSLSQVNEDIVAGSQFAHDMKSLRNKVLYLGKTVRVEGKVERVLHANNSSVRIELDADGFKITAVADPSRISVDALEPGSVAEVTGTFVTDGDNWHPDETFPHIGEWSLVMRSPQDIRIVRRAPWWTIGRLLAVAAMLVVALVASFAWIFALRHLANRRGRELFREQIARAGAQLRIDERTRLAAELHDSLSQNLSGIACQISAAKLTAGEGETKDLLATAERMLLSSRTELTRCIGDLRDDTLEDSDFNSAIKRNLDKLAFPATIRVRFAIPRAKVSDLTAHSILCIVRELVTNAVRHGSASLVKVSGAIDERGITFSVKDNGSGFDIDHRPGVQDGHFGLEGVKDRVSRLSGTFEIHSKPGEGASAHVFIPTSAHPKKDPRTS